MSEINHSLNYNDSIESYLKECGEKAYGLSWCHRKSERIFNGKRVWLELPTAIIALFNGFISASSNSIFNDSTLSSLVVGGIAILCGIFNTLGSYFAYGKRAENHRISALSYARLYRNISIQLKMHRSKRMECHSLVKYVRDEYDHLDETSAPIGEDVINEFKQKFNKPQFDKISKPEITNTLENISVVKEVIKESVSSPDFKSPDFGIKPMIEIIENHKE
jgi:hypothetical protein